METIDFSHLLWFFHLYSWNVHQHSLNKFGNIGTKTNKSMWRNINFALSLFIRQVNHKGCKWRSKVFKWVRTLDLQTNTLPIKKGYFKVLSRGIYYQVSFLKHPKEKFNKNILLFNYNRESKRTPKVHPFDEVHIIL